MDFDETSATCFSGGSRGGAWGTRSPPLFLDQTEARRAELLFLNLRLVVPHFDVISMVDKSTDHEKLLSINEIKLISLESGTINANLKRNAFLW